MSEAGMAEQEPQRAKIDRAKWPSGPWDEEPDRVEWYPSAGFPTVILRASWTGAWCGYVAVPPGHPMHGANYDDVPVDVHGGLTYAAPCRTFVCHVPPPGKPEDVWWLGFDCSHSEDRRPAVEAALSELAADRPRFPRGAVYRDMAYVKAECERLAEQLVALSTDASSAPER